MSKLSLSWSGKTIHIAEQSYNLVIIHFTDGSKVEISSYIIPSPSRYYNDEADLRVKYIGEAAESIEKGIICASFHAE